jgi:uncharacterized protein YbjT (DUF2867 family)
MTTVSVFGGTGFLGRRLVRRLATEGASVRVAVRHPERARSVLDALGLDRVTLLRADVRDRARSPPRSPTPAPSSTQSPPMSRRTV